MLTLTLTDRCLVYCDNDVQDISCCSVWKRRLSDNRLTLLGPARRLLTCTQPGLFKVY